MRRKAETISTCHTAERKATLSVELLMIFVNFFGGALYGEDGRKETLYANGAQAVFSEAAERETCKLNYGEGGLCAGAA